MEKPVERLSLQRLICKAGKRCFKALRKFSRRRPISPMGGVVVDAPPPDAPVVAPAIAAPEDSDVDCDYDSFDEISLTTVDTWVAGDEAVDNQLNEALEKKMAAF